MQLVSFFFFFSAPKRVCVFVLLFFVIRMWDFFLLLFAGVEKRGKANSSLLAPFFCSFLCVCTVGIHRGVAQWREKEQLYRGYG